MLEIGLLLLILGFFFITSEVNGAIGFLFLLPFHAFIKNILDFGFDGGGIFSYWKEIAIVLLLSKIYAKNNKLYLPKYSFFFAFGFLAYVTFSLLFAKNVETATAPFRDHVFTILILVFFYNLNIDRDKFRKMVFWLLISFSLTYVLGFVQLFLLKVPLAFLMGRVASIAPSGELIYTTTSARILGFERMAGVIGGPNGFGVFVALSLVFLFSLRITRLASMFSGAKFKAFIIISMFVGLVALIYSFSRAGWMIFFGGVLLLYLRLSILNFLKIWWWLIVSLIFLGGLFVILDDPMINNVISKTFAGEEDSSADRFNNFMYGVSEISKNFFGQGLGTTNNQFPEQIEFFVESATINTIYEIGFLGYFFFVSLNLVLIARSFFLGKVFVLPNLSLSVLVASLLASLLTVNTYGMPYILVSWAFVGIGINPVLNKSIQQYNLKMKL